MLSSSSTFASDLIDACANASAEMLDLHLTPYDLKSVHEYQISNHKKLTEVIQLLKCLLEENSRLRLTIGEIRDEISSRHTKTQGIQQTGEVISQQPPMSSLFQKSTEPINNQKHCHEAGHSNNLHPINSTTQSDLNYLDFPTLQQAHSSTLKPNAHPRGWAIAAACLPPSKSSREDRIIESPIVEIAGDIPEGNLSDKISSFVLRFNSTLCPALNGLGRDLTTEDISHIMLKNASSSQTVAVVRFASQITKDFIFKNRKKLQTSENSKLFLSPHLSLEDFQMQQRIVKVFKTFLTKEGDHYNFNIFPQGHFIKILSQETRHFYAFDSKVSPKDFLISKGIIV